MKAGGFERRRGHEGCAQCIRREYRWKLSPARSVSRFLCSPKRAATIPLDLSLLTGSSDLPGSGDGAGHSSSPIWSCSTWGLPCQSDCSGRGALLPHLFTLTLRRSAWRCIFCGTFRNQPFESWSPAVSRHAALWRPDFPLGCHC
jgi:hypothetical protein